MVHITYDRLSDQVDEAVDNVPQQSAMPRPQTYYGDGPFDAPSSDSDEDDLLLEKPPTPGLAERGLPLALRVGGAKRRPASLRCLVLCLVGLVALAAGIGALAAANYTGGQAYRPRGTKRIGMDHVMNGTFNYQRRGLNWVPEAGDGVYSTSSGLYIQLVDIATNTTTNLVSRTDITDEHGSPLMFGSWRLSADMKYILVGADVRKQWRHSSTGNYYIHEISTKITRAVVPPSNPPKIAYATWSPTGDALAYVHSNDLYVMPSPSEPAIRVTSSGNASLFHGVPDWVYEEEVFSSDYALWWSPDSASVAFLRLDETKVAEYSFPVYNPTENASMVVPYPDETVMKYPKPGYDNPLVSVHVFEVSRYVNVSQVTRPAPLPEKYTSTLTWPGAQEPADQVIQEVTWVGSHSLIVKEVNRAATNGSVVLFDLSATSFASRSKGAVVRRLGVDGPEADEGWIDASQTVFPLPAALLPSGAGSAYLDIVPSPQGYNHLALFSPASSSTPIFLTNGTWEVIGPIQAIDALGRVWYQAAAPSSIERHIYSITLPSASHPALASSPEVFTSSADAGPSNKDIGFYTASFSPKGGFALLNYGGPNVPWQRIISTVPVKKDGEKEKEKIDILVTDNKNLNQTLLEFDLPIITRLTIENDGVEMNAYELRPPRMDDSGRTKYPVLFKVYGGPGSTQTEAKFNYDWHAHLVSEHQYIVVVVDGRGTGYRGRKFRSLVRGNLGKWEVDDQIAAAKIWAGKSYVDDKRIGIWGWSYGGFMAAKTVERGAGVHTLGMSVAPVTTWELYDSIYTERYMDLPEANRGGYDTSSVHNMTAFHTTPYLLAHGSGDDNVHFANSAHLLDMFTQQRVRGFRFRMFTDSDHSMGKRGAYREVYEFLEEFLVEKWGVGAKRRGW